MWLQWAWREAVASRYVLEVELIRSSGRLVLHLPNSSSRELFLTSLFPFAPQPFAELGEERRGRAGLGGDQECSWGLVKSERPVRHTSDDVKLAVMRVEPRGGRGQGIDTEHHWRGSGT